MNDKDIYKESMSYENFIRLAHNTDIRDMSIGADNSFMQNLIWSELGRSNVKHLGNYEILLIEIKDYIAVAISKCLTKDLSSSDKEQFMLLQNDLKSAIKASDLIYIIDNGLSLLMAKNKG